jgi:hypothetical protein
VLLQNPTTTTSVGNNARGQVSGVGTVGRRPVRLGFGFATRPARSERDCHVRGTSAREGMQVTPWAVPLTTQRKDEHFGTSDGA